MISPTPRKDERVTSPTALAPQNNQGGYQEQSADVVSWGVSYTGSWAA